jgi:outer membrane lipoprotein-sorting protein
MKKVLFFLTLITQFAFAQQAKFVNPDAILLKFASKVKNSSTISIEFKTTARNPKTKFYEYLEGKQWVKGEKYYLAHGDVEEFANSGRYWSILKDHQTVLSTKEKPYLTELFINQFMVPIWNSDFNATYEREGMLLTDRVHIIKMTPKDPKKALYESIISYITKESNELKKMVFFRKDGTSTDYVIDKLDFTTPIKDNVFEFKAENYPAYKITEK